MSTTLYTNAIYAFGNLESQITTLDNQISTGVSVSSAADDPAAFTQAAAASTDETLLAGQTAAQTEAKAALSVGSTALQSASSLLDNAQSVILQAINGTTGGSDYTGLSQQLSAALTSMTQLANTQTPGGTYVFAGTAQGAQPFVQTGGSVQYFGDAGVSNVQIAPGVTINTALSGSIFTSVSSGDGYASVAAASGNAGSATLLTTGIADQTAATAFQQGSSPITLSFATGSSGLDYTATQNGSTIASGAVSEGSDGTQSIALDGINLQLSGTPASGDSFTVSPARPQSVFDLLSSAAAALAAPANTDASAAQVRQTLGNLLGGISGYQNSIAAAGARAGIAIDAIGTAATSNSERTTNDATQVSDLTAVNSPAAITELDQQTTALEAAMKAFASVGQLSLFNYIS